MHERQILHLQQQLAQTLQAFDQVRNFGSSPSLPPFGTAQPFMQPSMTDRAHMSNNGAPVLHNYDQSQLANSGMTNGTAYHSSVSAVPAMFSQSTQQVLNSQESNTIWHATQQPGMPHYGSNNSSAANSWHGSNARGVQSPSGGQVSMSMLESDPNALFAHLMQLKSHFPLDDVKREFYPQLFHKMQRAGIDTVSANHFLKLILESSNVQEILLMWCFDHVLQQRIQWARGMTQNAHARFNLPKSPEGSTSALSYDLRVPSEAGSARLLTPTPEVENIIRNLLCGRMEEAAAEFRTIQRDSNTQISRSSVPSLPLKETTNEAALAEASMTMSALKTLERFGNAEKVKFSTFKNAGTGKDETPSQWKDSFRSPSRDPKDPADIRNWTWKRFTDELYESTMYFPPDKKKLLEAFTSTKCQEPGTPEQITAYTHAYTLAFQELRRIGMHKQYSVPAQAQMYYDNLPKLLKHHMALYDPKRQDSELREDLSALRQEVREVMAWPVYKDAVSQASNGRAMGAMGVLVSGDPDERPKHIKAQVGETARFTTAATTQSTAWLAQNAAKFKCRHTVVGLRTGKPFHVIVGSTDKISAIFANKEARIAGLTEKVRKTRADANEAGAASSDLAKPIVSNVTAQAVQANMASQRAQVTPEDDAHAPSDLKPVPTPTAKMYSYNSSPMPSSNATHGGKARACFAVFCRTAPAPPAAFDPIVLSNTTLDNHDDLDTDIFFDACEVFGDEANAQKADDHELNGNKVLSPRIPFLFLPISISRRAAQCGKFALIALKYIATHELAGVLQPITT
jgi:hypothetical protein